MCVISNISVFYICESQNIIVCCCIDAIAQSKCLFTFLLVTVSATHPIQPTTPPEYTQITHSTLSYYVTHQLSKKIEIYCSLPHNVMKLPLD